MDYDDAYNNRDHIPNADAYVDRWEDDATAFRGTEAAIGRAMLNLSYGPHEREAFDLFFPKTRPRGLFFFVHGGYWRAFDRAVWSHFSAGAQALGWAVAMPSYVLAPEARLSHITRQIAAALAAASQRVAGPIVLAGHSAGGHLVARLGCRDVTLAPEIVTRVAHLLPISPVSDLRPLLQTAMNADFRMDAAEAEAESPRLLSPRGWPTSIHVGAEERQVFLDQARWLAEAWDVAALHVSANRHHFDVIDALLDPQSEMLAPLRSLG